jgi:hypothetical protein
VHTIAAELAKGSKNATLCLLHKRNKARKALAAQIVATHASMSASKREFTLLVYGRKLPKQHIIL